MAKGFENAFNSFQETTLESMHSEIKKFKMKYIQKRLLVGSQKLLLKQQ